MIESCYELLLIIPIITRTIASVKRPQTWRSSPLHIFIHSVSCYPPPHPRTRRSTQALCDSLTQHPRMLDTNTLLYGGATLVLAAVISVSTLLAAWHSETCDKMNTRSSLFLELWAALCACAAARTKAWVRDDVAVAPFAEFHVSVHRPLPRVVFTIHTVLHSSRIPLATPRNCIRQRQALPLQEEPRKAHFPLLHPRPR